MTMRSRSPKFRQFGSAITALLLAVIVVLGIMFSGALFRLGSALIVSVSAPASEEYANLPRAVLAGRLKDAEQELARIRYQAVLSSALVAENERLLLELAIREDDETGVGRVVSAPPKTHYDTLLVSLPDNHAVSEGDVALFEGIVIGEVERTGSRAALVRLLTSPGLTTDVRVGEPGAIVVAQGLGGGAYVFDVPSGVSVASGDAVLSASYGARVLGVVGSVVADPDRTTKRVYAHAAAALSDIRFVHFIRPVRSVEDDS